MSNLFQTLEIEAFRAGITPRTKESIEWFRKKARQLYRGRDNNINRRKLLQDNELELKNRPITRTDDGPVGNMYMFFYDAKYKDTLPYYDAFPLILMLGPAKGGFYGLNLHYLPPVLRAKALDAALDDNRESIPKKFVNPMIHRYLFNHVRSRFALVDKPEWEIATFLPTADFQGAGTSTVYRDSRRKM